MTSYRQVEVSLSNPSKCIWFLFNWEFCPNGTIWLKHPQDTNIKVVTNLPHPPYTTHSMPLTRWSSLLSWLEHNLLQMAITIRKSLACFTNGMNASSTYNTIAHSPTGNSVLYAYSASTSQLQATHYQQPWYPIIHVIHHAQKWATTIFITKFGYPTRTFPHAITYATSARSGLDFHHLGHKAQVQQAKPVDSQASTMP